MGNENIIDMTPNASGVFEADETVTVKPQKRRHRVVRPESPKQTRPAKRKSEYKVKRNPVKRVPNPVEDFQDGVQVGLDLLKNVKTIIKVFR